MWKEIIEGKTKLIVPEKGKFGKTKKGKEKKAPVFYNPKMKLTRDICCAVVKALLKKGNIAFADLLAGSGAKGIRVAKETGCEVHLNDANEDAYFLIQKNAAINNLKVEISNREANHFLQENRNKFNFIDIDPFGTPVPFIDNAIMTVREEGYLGVTATDAAPLCGVYPIACYRKYGAMPLRSEFCHEVAMRILLGYIAKTCAKYSNATEVLLSHYIGHCFRVYIRLNKGKKKADRALSDMGYLYYCRNCLNRTWKREALPTLQFCDCGNKYEVAGPLWLGELKSDTFCNSVLKSSRYLEDKKLERYIDLIAREEKALFYFDLHKIAKSLGMEVIPIDKIMNGLEEEGFRSTRTHFSPTSIKTDGRIDDLKKIFRKY